MICFNCGYKLSGPDTKACNLCGMKFPLSCGFCGSSNPLMANYCFNCGTKIIGQSPQSSVQNFDVLSENRKNVAVIFADISGFTALSERLDPEEVREIINNCFDYITKPVYELEGTIDKYIGDCVMILFGAKYSHSDDALRAVTCAMKMMDNIKQFSKEMLFSKGVSLSVSIGINYGLVVTGSVGNYFDKDYTVIGDTVNTAQRLQSAADKGEILASQSVYAETQSVVQYSEMREMPVKNKEKPVKCFAPLQLLKPYDQSADSLIEREGAYNRLVSTLKAAEASKTIAVIGESGIGKTSLVKSFVSSLDKDIRVIWKDCDPIYQKRVYFLISNLLYDAANIGYDAGSGNKKTRLLSYIEYLLKEHSKEEVERNFDFIGLIMGLERSRDFQDILNSMKYDDIKREIVNQLSIFIAELCKDQQVVFVVDDIQYADSESIDLLVEVMKRMTDVKLALIFNTAYETEQLEAFDASAAYKLKLERLSQEGVRSQLIGLLECEHIDGSLLDSVYLYTNGNPLFVKEFSNAVKRDGSCTVDNGTAYLSFLKEKALPGSIESIIMSNLSELDEVSTRLLQAASVIGKEFSLSWVKSILDTDVDMSEALKLPEQMNIISLKSVRTSSGVFDSMYTFEREMVREAIYNSILNKNRKHYHAKLSEMIETVYSRELEHYYELLCIHYEAAGLDEKAGDYYLKTAVKMKLHFNYSSALEYFEKYINRIREYGEEASKNKLLHAYMETADIHSLLTEYDKASELLDKALNIAGLGDDIYAIKLMLVKVYFDKTMYSEAMEIIKGIENKIRQNSSTYGKMLQLKCSILRMQGNPEAFGIAERSEEILLRNKDFENLSETMSQIGILYFIKGEMENGIYYFNKAYSYAERINNLRVMGAASNNLGIAHHASGMISKAQENFKKSIELSKKTSHIQNYISNNINLGILYMDKGLFGKAEQLFLEALDKAEQVSSLQRMCLAQLNLGDLYYEIGDSDKAREYYLKSLEIAESRGMAVDAALNRIELARLDMKSGALEGVVNTLNDAYAVFAEAEEVGCISDYFRYRSIYELRLNNAEEALELCDKAISYALEANNDMKKLRALRLKGNILSNSGNLEKALLCYDESINLAIQLESDYEAAKGCYRKYAVLYKMNRFDEAEECLNEARAAIGRIDKCRWTEIIKKNSEEDLYMFNN